MGLIKALTSSVGSTLGDQFKEFVTCPTIENNVMIVRGTVQHGEGNKNPSEGVISNGSAIAVPEGMAMMIVENGKIVEFSSEPGTYTWNTSTEPSIFAGNLGESIKQSFKTLGSRITFGGQTAKDQRVYYVNIKTMPNNLFGSQQPETIYDPVYGSVEITYNGEYALKVVDPIVLIQSVVGSNPKDLLTFDDIFGGSGQNILKSRFAQKVSEAIANIMESENISFNRIQSKKSLVTEEMNKILDEEWKQKYGLEIEDVSLRINASEESLKIIREVDADVSKTTRMGQVYSNNMTGTMAAASAEAMKNASKNENGAMMGFAGLNMASNAGANMMGVVSNMPQNNNNNNNGNGDIPNFCPNCGTKTNGAKFCSSCGTKLG